MIDPTPWWDFDDAPASEQRLRAALERATPADRQVLLTQVARALGLQERYDEAHAVLDSVAPPPGVAPDEAAEIAVRADLERGRVLRSSGRPVEAAPLFEAAAERAARAGLDLLHVDALHMVALVAPPDRQVALGEQALAVARASADSRARDWDASLLANIGMAHADAADFAAALTAFEGALEARLRIGDPGRTRVARWMVAWALRHLGRSEEALVMQRDLKAELVAAGAEDPYVDEELALLAP